MFSYQLPDGRSIDLMGFRLEDTYSGVLEGSRETASQYIREGLPERIAKILPPGNPLVVIAYSKGELPPWLCVDQFESFNGRRTAYPASGSRLYVCWFLEDTLRDLDAEIKLILPKIDWEGLAENFTSDFDPDDF
jgi:hypothetical protein